MINSLVNSAKQPTRDRYQHLAVTVCGPRATPVGRERYTVSIVEDESELNFQSYPPKAGQKSNKLVGTPINGVV
jgi:hypothetical protein